MCNVVDDQDLKGPVDKSRTLLEGVSTDMAVLSAKVREGLTEVAVQMDVLVDDRVSRKFRFDEEGGQNHVPKCEQSHSDRLSW